MILAAELIEFATVDGLAVQAELACLGRKVVAGYAFLQCSILADAMFESAEGLALALEQFVETETLVTSDSLAKIQNSAENLLDLLELKVESSEPDVEEVHTVAQQPLDLSVGLARAKSAHAVEVIAAAAAAAGFVAAEGDVLVPYNAVPILGWHLEDYHRPFQQKPWESCMAGFPHLMMFAAFLIQSCAVPVAASLVASSLPPACAYPLRPLHAASFSSTLLRLAIVAAVQVTAP